MAENIYGLDFGTGAQAPTAPFAPPRPAVVPPSPPAPPVASPPAAPVGQPVMRDIETTAAQQVSPEQLAAAAREINIQSQMGAQGAPMRSDALAQSTRADAVSRFLASQLQNLEQPSRFGSIAGALVQRMIEPSKTFGEHLTAIESAPIDRAYKIATAMAGLGKQTDQLTQKDLIPLAVAQIRANAERGDKDSAQFFNFLRAITSGADDAAGATQVVMEEVAKAKQKNPGATATDIFTQATPLIAARLRAEGIETGKPRKEEVSTGATGGGPKFDSEGNLIEFTPWTGAKLSRDEQAANTHFKTFGASSMPGYFKMMEEKARGAAARADVTKVQKMKEAINEMSSILRLTDSISRGIAEGAAVGGVAMLQMALGGVKDQVSQLAATPIKYGEGANTLTTSVQELQNPLGANATWARVTGGNQGLKNALSWVDMAPQAQAIKTNMLLLSFSVARAIDPGGRLSNKDVESVLMALGSAGSGILTNRAAMLEAMRQVEDYASMRVQDRYNQDRTLYEKNNVILPKRTGRAPGEAAGGYGNRSDGTAKGNGYFGPLRGQRGEISTEISIGVEFDGVEREIPTMVPTLTRSELDYLLGGGRPTEQIVDKAVAFARQRIKKGLSPFAGPNERYPLPPAPGAAEVLTPGRTYNFDTATGKFY